MGRPGRAPERAKLRPRGGMPACPAPAIRRGLSQSAGGAHVHEVPRRYWQLREPQLSSPSRTAQEASTSRMARKSSSYQKCRRRSTCA
eukprot:9306469-Alexandrium_andersonii.AAC.1